jgi:hypothetical protein
MTRTVRNGLLSAATLAASIILAGGAVAAQDEMGDEPASMSPTEATGSGLQIMEAWARESPMLDLAGAAYMVIRNGTDADDALVGASSPAAAVVELHLSSMNEEGMMSMNQVTEIPVPAGGEAVLKPGSYHVMLIDLIEPLEAGSEIELALEFMAGDPQTITVPVMAGGPMMGDMDMDGEDHDDMDMDETDEDAEADAG